MPKNTRVRPKTHRESQTPEPTRAVPELLVQSEPGPATAPLLPMAAGPELTTLRDQLQVEDETVRRIGSRWATSASILERWTSEASMLARQMGEALRVSNLELVVEQSRRLNELVDWMREAAREGCYYAEKASEGKELQSANVLIRAALRCVEGQYSEIEFQGPALEPETRVLGSAAVLHEAYLAAIAVLACRIGARGSIEVELSEGNYFTLHHFRGTPEPGAEPLEVPELLLERLHALVRRDQNGKVFPGYEGTGTSLILAIPQRSGARGHAR